MAQMALCNTTIGIPNIPGIQLEYWLKQLYYVLEFLRVFQEQIAQKKTNQFLFMIS